MSESEDRRLMFVGASTGSTDGETAVSLGNPIS